MFPYIVPVGLFIVLVLIRRMPAAARRYTVSDAAAWSLAPLLVLIGGAHFVGLREDLIRMVPPVFPRPDLWVTITGVFELMGAAGLMFHRTRFSAGVALALLFVALLPANIYAARQGLLIGGEPVTPLVRRIPEQIIFIALALGAAFGTRSKNTTKPRQK